MKKIFICYSHNDEKWKDRVNNHLRVFQLEGICHTWDDRQIKEGTLWEKEIIKQIQSAHAAVLLITTDFLISDFIMTKEVPLILERWGKQEIIVFPVIVEPCAWDEVNWLREMQVFPKDGIPLAKMRKVKRIENLVLLAKKVKQLLQGTACAAAGDAEGIPGSATFPGNVNTILLTGLPKRQIKLLGRENELAELEKKLVQSKRVLLVNGLGGIGKTEVCKRFFMDHYKKYSHAAWVDYVSSIKETFVNAFTGKRSDFIRGNSQDSLDDLFHKVLQFLNGLDANSLLIIDNIDNPEDEDLDMISAFPFKVIANSRLNIKGFDIHSLDFLSDDSCKSLFYEHYKCEKDDEHVEKIIHLCNRHTLTVELLARTAQNATMPVKALYKTLKEKGFNLNELIGEKVDTFWRNEKKRKQFFDHLLTIFDLSRVTGSELYVLTNLSVLPPIYIDMNEFSEWIKLKTKDDINSLVIKGWLKQDGFNIFMHQVIQEVIRHKTIPDAKKCEKLIDSLTDKLHLEPAENPLDKKRYVIFAEEVCRHIDEKTNALATLANNLSMIYQDLGQLDRALEFQLKTAGIFEQVLDKNHPSLATSYNNLSLIYQDLGQLDRALEFQLKDVEISEQVLDKNHPSLATSYNNLSSIYKALGQLDRALEFQLKAVEIREQVLAKNHPDIAQSYNNLSMIYKDLGQLDRARPFAQKAVDIMTALFPNGHYNLDIFRRNLESLKR